MSLHGEIVQALNAFEMALRVAVREDTLAETDETWEAKRLRKCEAAWDAVKAARVDLEAIIVDHIG